MSTYTRYRGSASLKSGTADSNRYPSENIWADCPWDQLRDPGDGPTQGYAFYDDFTNHETVAAGASAVTYSNYYVDADTGVTFAQLANQDHGVAQIAANDAAEDGIVVCHGNQAGFARFTTADQVWFECRVQQASVADTASSWFLGLAETTVAPTATATIVDSTGIVDASEDFIGWRTIHTDGNAMEFIYQEGGQTIQQIGTGSTNAVGSGTDVAITAATNVKIGLKYSAGTGESGGAQGRIEGYVNGVLTVWYDIASSANWPDANHMAMLLAHKTVDSSAHTFNIDWWKVAALSE